MTEPVRYYIKNLEYENSGKEYFVIEGVSLNVENLHKELEKSKYIFICIAYQNISLVDKVTELNKYENENDWTKDHTEKEKLEIFENKMKEGKIVKEMATRLGIEYFDTSYNREKVIDEIMDYLRREMK